MSPNARQPLEHVRAAASYHRQRYDLYKAKTYGGRLTSPASLRELEQASARAEARLQAALRARGA